MKVPLFLIVDYANISAENKLNVMGIFDTINSPSFPCLHPQLQLVIQCEASPAEAGKRVPVELKLLDADGRVCFNIQADLQLPPKGSFRQNQLITLNNIQFEKPGRYEFVVLINGDHKAQAPLSLFQIASTS